jgi:hypothetical protein
MGWNTLAEGGRQMSELKAYIGPAPDEKGLADYYLKSDADKVIADLEESHKKEVGQLLTEIAELKAQKAQAKTFLEDAASAMHETEEYARKLYKEAQHHKYKRCLAMAMWCFEKSYSTTLVKYDKESGLLRNFYDWWGKRWLELAEKFKEPK